MAQPAYVNRQLELLTPPKGVAILLSVLIFGAIGTAIATMSILLGLSASRNSFTLQQSLQAKGLANACTEQALQRLREGVYYTGNETFTFPGGSCQILLITGTGNVNRTLTSVGTVGTVQRKVQVMISQINPTILVTSWQEIP